MGNCNNNIAINSNVFLFSFRNHNIASFYSIYIEKLNLKEINKVKKELININKINNTDIKNIIFLLKYLNKSEDDIFKSNLDFYLFINNYIPLLKVINKNVIKKDDKFYYKICNLDKL